MGAPMGNFVERTEKPVEDIAGDDEKVVAIDTWTWFHAFLNSIRAGKNLLRDEEGRVTSHLKGLYPRTMNMLDAGLRPVFILEGGYPELKEEEISRRTQQRKKNEREQEIWQLIGDPTGYDGLADRGVTDEMVQTAVELIDAMGCPYMTPPEEAESQAARMCDNGQVDFVISQDYDTLLYGSPVMIQNLNSSDGEIIWLERSLRENDLDFRQFLWLGILLGSDYHDGAHGIGPKRGLNIVQEVESIGELIERAKERDPDVDGERWRSVYQQYANPAVDLDYEVPSQSVPDEDRIHEILVEKHGFSEDRVMNRAEDVAGSMRQSSLGGF